MVLKRRLPSAMASEEKKNEDVKASPSVEPKEKETKKESKVSFDDISDEMPAKKVAPLAPEPEINVTESAMSKTEGDSSSVDRQKGLTSS